jgi:hypothetical protein
MTPACHAGSASSPTPGQEQTTSDELVPEGTPRPKRADFRAWTELLANTLAAGESAAKLRSYLKKLAVENWEYVNWLTHAKNAVRKVSEEERARRLATPCVPSSDISTFMGPDDFR